jgi:hypothetical protein
MAVDAALAQRGLPYVWGGNGPAGGDEGFDCSGLTAFAYAAAGLELPRTAHAQYHAGPHLRPGAPLLPGDLVFYGVPERVHHVGIYVGDGRMAHAPRFGEPVHVVPHRWPGDRYLGATRPAATGRSGPDLDPAPASPAPPLPPPHDVLAASPEPSDEPPPVDVSAPATPPALPPDALPQAHPPVEAPSPTDPLPDGPRPPVKLVVGEPVGEEPADGPPSVVGSWRLRLSGGAVELAAVALGTDGLPVAAGIVPVGDATVARIAPELLDGAVPGVEVTLAPPDGPDRTLALRGVEEVDAAAAAARLTAVRDGGLLVLARLDDGRWTVLDAVARSEDRDERAPDATRPAWCPDLAPRRHQDHARTQATSQTAPTSHPATTSLNQCTPR